MKKFIRITASSLLFMMALNTVSIGQEYLKMERSKRLQFENESEAAEAKIHVSEEYNFLRIQIHSALQEGEIIVEVIDPKGSVKGNFSLVASGDVTTGNNTYVESGVNGEMERAYRDPENGNWIIRITPKKAVGMTEFRSTLIFNPRADMLEIEQIVEDTDSNIE